MVIFVSWHIHAALAQPPAQPVSEADRFAAVMVKMVQVIDREHVTPASKPQLFRWAIEGLYKEVKRPLPADLAARMKTLETADAKEIRNFLADARRGLKMKKGLENDKDLVICARAIFVQLEPGDVPRSELMLDAEPLGLHRGEPVATPTGVGVIVAADKATGMLRVVTPIYNGPAYKAGIRAGGIITQIRTDTDADGKPLERPMAYSTKGMSVERANELMLGRAGTSVKLSVIPAASAKATSGK